MKSLYRRPLPPTLVAFGSPQGRRLFDEARAEGGMEAFFALIEQFHTQSEPAFCGLGTLVVALNALGIDPERLWRGPWRWFSEELLDCCTPLDRVRAQGISLDEFACLARCNGALAETFRPDAHDEHALREAIATAAACAVEPALVVSYARGGLGQTGGGHFSPIGGYHRASDHALVLDVARFKYPPHWVPVSLLYAAMKAVDPSTGSPRGWVTLHRGHRPASLLFTARWKDDHDVRSLAAAFETLRERLWRDSIETLPDLFRALVAAAADFPLVFEPRELSQPEHVAAATSLREGLHRAELFTTIAAVAPAPSSAEAITLLALAIPHEVWGPLPPGLHDSLLTLVDPVRLPGPVCEEVQQLREQLQGLRALEPAASGCGPR